MTALPPVLASTRRMRRLNWSLVLVSPLMLLGLSWGLSLGIAVSVLSGPEHFDLAHFFIGQHRLDLDAFSLAAGLRLALLATVLVLGHAVAGLALTRDGGVRGQECDAETAIRWLWWVNLTFVGVTALWVALSARQVGGIAGLIQMVRQDAYLAREVLLDNKLFTGMRLFYAALPATGCLAAAILACAREVPLSQKAITTCVAVVAINLIILVLLPIVMSQRLILLQYLISVHVAVCMVRGRLVAGWLIPVGVGLFLLTWVLHEAVTNPDIDRTATEIAAQKLAFYVINDLWNSFRPFDIDIPHTFGLFTFQFAMFFTLTDGMVIEMMRERIDMLAVARGGGEFSLLSAPYVDFGFFCAALYLFLIGVAVRIAFHRGQGSVLWAAIYGQVATALILSVHVNYFASQDFVFSILVMVTVIWWSRSPAAGRHAAP